jgi:hypothetical protein
LGECIQRKEYSMQYFYCKLVAPRTTFVHDMSDAETAVMGKHAMYWKGLIDGGATVYALGLVLDPAGAFGVGIIGVESEAEIRELTANDPAIKSNCGFRYDIHPMPRGVMHSQ